MPRATLIEEFSGAVLRITLNRPERKNAFNHQMWCDVRDALAEAQADDAVRVVVITGAGDAFSAGQDLSEMVGGGPAGTSAEHGFGSFMDRLCVFDKPLIAAVNGVGVGIGLTLLLHCEYVYIAGGARLRAPFITLGVVPEAASSFLLPALIGYRNAIDLLFESDFISAERAVALGIATQLCAPEALLPTALDRARRLAAKPLGSLRWTKRLLLATRQEQVAAARRREDEAFLHRIGSRENIEAVSAFFEKRHPDFSHVPPTDREP
ncbi:MAG TPA: enoyl-CoA hydratase-related protein [Candidatus Acidoferrales bacterium]|nr:enoyl-CoA hydratase-related protein [Candidatus Acidoferrales bacterium]